MSGPGQQHTQPTGGSNVGQTSAIVQNLLGGFRQNPGTGNNPQLNPVTPPILLGGSAQNPGTGNSPQLSPGTSPTLGNFPSVQGQSLSTGSSPTATIAQTPYSPAAAAAPAVPQTPHSPPPPAAPAVPPSAAGGSSAIPQTPPNPSALPSVAQEPAKGRTIILCFDGTGNKFGKNSNVVRFMSALERNDPDRQMIYYQPGIGTYTPTKYITRSFTWLSTKLDAAFARNLSGHVLDGYRFLMKNHRPGDKICLFGFSRGAYTARALSGMIYKVGLLLPDNNEQLDFAYQIYNSTDLETSVLAREFKKTFSLSVHTYLLGVWDTVASVGLIPRSLPYATQNDGVIYFRHALALDERRARFRPNLWGEPIGEREELDTVPQLDQIPMSDDAYVYHPPKTTDVQEVWFAGAHADVGGGSHPTWYSTSLSRIPLRWMIRECFQTKTGILFNAERLKESADLNLADFEGTSGKPIPIHNLPPNRYAVGWSWFRTMSTSDNVKDLFSEIFDQLSMVFFWWIIELLPSLFTYQKGDGSWSRMRRRNFGNGRYLPHHDEQILVHESVRDRIRDEKADYWPKAYNWDMVKDHIDWQK